MAHSLGGFGVLIPEIERFNILGSIFASSLFPERAPKGCVLLTNYVGGARAPHLADETTDRLVALTVADLRRMLGVSGSPVFQHVTVYRHAIPQYEMDFGTHLQNMNDIEQHAPGLLLQGHYRDGTGLSDS
ncbi:MAG: protoporphyrinogen oxidase, partial [Pedosphaera sp.]|nr:protoporphyrinogen oxidase [Pedosphaera sp.]